MLHESLADVRPPIGVRSVGARVAGFDEPPARTS